MRRKELYVPPKMKYGLPSEPVQVATAVQIHKKESYKTHLQPRKTPQSLGFRTGLATWLSQGTFHLDVGRSTEPSPKLAVKKIQVDHPIQPQLQNCIWS